MRLISFTYLSHSIFYIFVLVIFQEHVLLIQASYFMEGVRFEVQTITSKSFEEDVVEKTDAWILAVKGTKISEEQWQTEENQLRGVVNVAFVDLEKDEEFWLNKGILDKHQSNVVAIVFPYGGEKIKEEKFKHVNSVKEAKSIALLSLSENSVTWMRNKMEVERFVGAAYRSWPPRFPVVLSTEKRVTPPLYRALSLKYSRFFNFGIVHKNQAHAAMGLPKGVKMPRMDILISSLTADEKFAMGALTYETEKYGPVQYRYLIRFLFSVHEKYWPDLPGSKMFTEELGYKEYYKEDLERIFARPELNKSKSKGKSPKDIEEINYDNHKKICGDSIPGYCVVAFLDGSSKIFKQQLSVIAKVQNDELLQERVLHFMWINATCYPEYGSLFGVHMDLLPALLIARPHRRHFVKHSGKFDEDSILDFIEKSLTGTLNFSPYSRFDDLDQRICKSPSQDNTKLTAEDPGNGTTAFRQEDLKFTEEEQNREKRKKKSHKNGEDL